MAKDRAELLTKAAAQDRMRSEDARIRHERGKRRMNIILSLLFMGIVVLFVAFYEGRSLVDNIASLMGRLTIENASYKGTDENGNPYEIGARHAYPDGVNPDLVDLEEVEGFFSTEDGAPLNLTAQSGTVYIKERRFRLAGKIRLAGEREFEAKADRANGNINDEQLAMAGNVSINHELGFISSDEAVINKKSNQATFKGNVRLIIKQEKK